MSVVRYVLVAVVAIAVLGFLAVEAVRQANKPRPLAVPLPSQGKVSPTERAGSPKSQRPTAQYLKDITDQVKVDFVQAVGPLGSYFMPEINGSGGALFDYDNDGDLDLFLVNMGKSPKAPMEFPADTRLSHRLYQRASSGQYTDVTSALGFGNQPATDVLRLGIGCAVGDVNNDGFPDVYVTNYGPDQLFINRSAQRFEDRTKEAQLGCAQWGTAAAFFDYDRDGWLDLVVTNYAEDPVHGLTIACGFTDGTVSYCGPHKFKPTIDRLYHNEGPQSIENGVPKFRDVTESSGLGAVSTYGLGLAVCDFDGDTWLDIFVASDMRENRLWINNHDGTFREEATPRGCALSGEGMMQGCMGVAVADFDHDLDFDLVVTNLVTEGSTLYVNDGRGVFRDESLTMQVFQNTKQHTGWGVALIDLNHDGNFDMPMVNGFVVPNKSMFPPHGEDKFQERIVRVERPLEFLARYNDKNKLLMGTDKHTFRDQTLDSGEFGADEGLVRSLIYGDIDLDGDLDLVTTSVGGRARVFQNDFPNKGHWLSIRCWLPEHKRDALGAVVQLFAGDQSRIGQCAPSTSYLASNEPFVHFGLEKLQKVERIEVLWPDGRREKFPGATVDQRLTLSYGQGEFQ